MNAMVVAISSCTTETQIEAANTVPSKCLMRACPVLAMATKYTSSPHTPKRVSVASVQLSSCHQVVATS
jgi:hypothetical protein